jgi:hypothetical protein
VGEEGEEVAVEREMREMGEVRRVGRTGSGVGVLSSEREPSG